jgi:hypothetical protein
MTISRALLALTLLAAGIGVVGAGPAGATENAPVGTEAEFRAEVAALAADNNPSNCPHTIRLDDNITLAGATDPDYSTGTCPLTIDGDGHTLSGGGNSRVIFAGVTSTQKLTLTDITVTQGFATDRGGAVQWKGEVDLIDMVGDNNHVNGAGPVAGGFLSSQANVAATDSAFTNNRATATAGNAEGGVVSIGTVGKSFTADGVVASGNQAVATASATGGAFYILGPADIDQSILNGNAAVGDVNGQAGALYARTTIDVDDSAFNANGAIGTSTLSNGGAIGAPRVGISTVANINDTSLIGNSVTGPHSTVNGSAVDVNFGHLYVRNTTVTGNQMLGSAGGAALHGQNVYLLHATVISNTSPSGSASISAVNSLTSTASVVADPLGGGDNCSRTATSNGYNWADDTTCGFTNTANGDVEDVAGDPVLGPPRDNGGVVDAVVEPGEPPFNKLTMFPLAGSPLVDSIPAVSCLAAPELDLDQREVDRPVGSGCDTGAIEAVYPAHGLSDVPSWVEAAVRWLTSPVNDPRIMSGYPDGTFRPNINISRAQFVNMLYHEAGAPAVADDHPFGDVPGWINNAVNWALDEGIMTGYPGNLFNPDLPITRGQATNAKWGLAGQPGGAPAHPFVDVPGWLTNSVNWAAHHALMSGFAGNLFKPNDNITRAQVANVDYNLAITPTAWDDPTTAPGTVPFRPSPDEV